MPLLIALLNVWLILGCTAEVQSKIFSKKLSIKLCEFRIGLEYYQNGKNNEEEDEEQEEHIEFNLDNNDADDDE